MYVRSESRRSRGWFVTHTKESLDKRQDVTLAKKMAAFSFAAWSIKDCLEEPKEVMINVRSRNKRSTEVLKDSTPKKPIENTVPEESEEPDTLTTTAEYWGAVNIPPMIHLAMSEDTKVQWKKAYLDNPMFKSIAKADDYQYDKLEPGRQFFMDNNGMIFFSNENYQPRLCVPARLRNFILWEAHENLLKSAHAGPKCLWQSLSSRFYWKRMKVNIIKYCQLCDVCQKMKSPNFTKYGMLIPNPIPS